MTGQIIALYHIGRPVRATITLYPIGRPVRATIVLYPIVRPVKVTTVNDKSYMREKFCGFRRLSTNYESFPY